MTTLRATPGRILALIVGLPVMLAGVGWGALTVVGLLSRTSDHHHVVYAWKGGAVSLHVGSGDAEIRAADTRTVTVDYTEHYEFKRPVVQAQSTPQGLSLTGSCHAGILGQNCEINYVVTVPKQAALNVHLNDGTLTLQAITAAVTARVDTGGVHGSQLGSRQLRATIGDGSVRLQWATAPVTVTANAGNGNIDVTVPNGSGPYAVRLSGSGGSSVRVATDPAAPASMVLHTGDGSVHVGYGS